MNPERNRLNNDLRANYGVDTVSGLPMWRLVWSEDEVERRLGDYTDVDGNGNVIREVRELRNVKKYAQYASERFILENLQGIPFERGELGVQNDLPGNLSYEPMWTFELIKGHLVLPSYRACAFVIDTVNAAKGKGSLAPKYVDDEITPGAKYDRCSKIKEELFGEHPEHSEKHGDTIISIPGLTKDSFQ